MRSYAEILCRDRAEAPHGVWRHVAQVAGFLRALGLAEWTETFLTHRIQGDVMFSLTEVTLAEMGVAKIGDRLYLVDCLQVHRRYTRVGARPRASAHNAQHAHGPCTQQPPLPRLKKQPSPDSSGLG